MKPGSHLPGHSTAPEGARACLVLLGWVGSQAGGPGGLARNRCSFIPGEGAAQVLPPFPSEVGSSASPECSPPHPSLRGRRHAGRNELAPS